MLWCRSNVNGSGTWSTCPGKCPGKNVMDVSCKVSWKESRTTKYRGEVCVQDLKWGESVQFPNHYRFMNRLPRELSPQKIGETRYGSRVTMSEWISWTLFLVRGWSLSYWEVGHYFYWGGGHYSSWGGGNSGTIPSEGVDTILVRPREGVVTWTLFLVRGWALS